MATQKPGTLSYSLSYSDYSCLMDVDSPKDGNNGITIGFFRGAMMVHIHSVNALVLQARSWFHHIEGPAPLGPGNM
jgi:hypothetical protein